MNKTLFLLFILAIYPTTMMAQNQQAPATPESKLVQFQMAILKRGPKWSSSPDTASSVHKQHVDYVQSLLGSGESCNRGTNRS